MRFDIFDPRSQPCLLKPRAIMVMVNEVKTGRKLVKFVTFPGGTARDARSGVPSASGAAKEKAQRAHGLPIAWSMLSIAVGQPCCQLNRREGVCH